MTMLTQSMRIKPLRRTPIAYGVLTKSRLRDELLDDWLEPGHQRSGASARTRPSSSSASRRSRPSRPRATSRASPRPTLFAWAPEDRWFKVAHADSLAASMPDARVVRIPDAKTFVSIDQPDRLAEEIAGFIRATKPAAVAA